METGKGGSVTRAADRRRWGDRANYNPSWATRARRAARHVPDGIELLEIGVGTGAFRTIVEHRCRYLGADLQPLAPDVLALDLDADPLPAGRYDMIVLLGVLEYLARPEAAVAKLCAAANGVLLSYCCVPDEAAVDTVRGPRERRGWINALRGGDLRALFEEHGMVLLGDERLNAGDGFDQRLIRFARR